MNPGHEEFNDWAGAYAFGALDPDDRRAFERHLAECSICSHDVKAFAPIPGLLASVDRSELADVSDPNTAAAITSRVRNEEQQLRTSRKRWRLAALGSAAAALLILGGLLAVATGSEPNGAGSPAADAVAAVVTSSRVESAAVFTQARGWGTQIQLEIAGLPPRQEYKLWAVDRSGRWSAAATWGPTPTGGAKVTGATSLETETLDRLVVTSQDRDDVLIEAST